MAMGVVFCCTTGWVVIMMILPTMIMFCRRQILRDTIFHYIFPPKGGTRKAKTLIPMWYSTSAASLHAASSFSGLWIQIIDGKLQSKYATHGAGSRFAAAR